MFSHFLQALLMDCVSTWQNCHIVPWFKQVLEKTSQNRFVNKGRSCLPCISRTKQSINFLPQSKWGNRDALLLQHKGDCSWEGLNNNSLVERVRELVRLYKSTDIVVSSLKSRGYLVQKMAYHTCSSERNFHVHQFWNERRIFLVMNKIIGVWSKSSDVFHIKGEPKNVPANSTSIAVILFLRRLETRLQHSG